MTDDYRRMPVPDAIRWLIEHGHPADPRDDIDTASLVRRFPRLGSVEIADVDFAVPLRTYRDPSVPYAGRGLVWVHGGAFLGGSLDMPESHWVALELAARGIPVLAVDYTKCLGVHYPVPSDEVLAAWDAAPALLGLDPAELALGGASAGSTLVSGAVVRGAAPAELVLVYPFLHPDGPGASADVDLGSPHGQLALNYAGSSEALLDPAVFAGLADPSLFPPTLVVVCEDDALRPSGEAFAAAVGADLHLEPGARHGHIDNPGDDGALRTIAAIADWLGGRPSR